MPFGDVTKLVKAELVKLQIGSGDELITLYNLRGPSKKPDVLRINSRAGAIDFYSYPIEEVTADCMISKDVLVELEGLSTMTARGALPAQAFVILGLNLDGVTGDDITINFTANVSQLDYSAPDKGIWSATFTLRILNSTRVVT